MATYESTGQLVIDGVPAYDLTGLTKTTDAQKNRVFTSEGFAGISRGAGFTEIQVMRAIPIAGSNIDVEQYVDSSNSVPVQVFTGGKVYAFDAHFERSTNTTGVNRAAENAFTLVGPLTLGIPA